MLGHTTDMCPLLQEESFEQVNVAGSVLTPKKQYDPYYNTYNSGWRDHPNFSYGRNR